jgi:hypothetical protein
MSTAARRRRRRSRKKLYTQNFEIQVPKGTPFVKGFEILSRNRFHGSKMVLLCSEGRFSREKFCQINPRMSFLEQNLES